MAESKETVQTLTSAELFSGATAPEAEPPAPAPEAPAPEPAKAAPEPPASEPAKPEPPVPPTPEPPQDHIPSWRLRQEIEERRRAEEHARMLEARLNEVAAHIQQNQKQPDFFEDPDQAARRIVMQHIQPYAEETRRNLMYMGKMVASSLHGADKVEEAEQAFLRARDEQSLDPADYERVVQSPNRYDAVVQWHKRQRTLAAVGDDPAAWFERQLEARMADPQFQAKLVERVRGEAARRPTVTELPPTLSRSTAAAASAPEVVGDLSSASLFASATGGMKR